MGVRGRAARDSPPGGRAHRPGTRRSPDHRPDRLRPISSRDRMRPAASAIGTSRTASSRPIVDDVGFQADLQQATGAFIPIQTHQAVSGGTLIDLGLVGRHDDQITSIYPLLNTNPPERRPVRPRVIRAGQSGALPSVLAQVDATAGEASLTVHGFARLGPNPKQLTIETRYSVRSGEHFVRMPLDAAQHGHHGAPDLHLRRHHPARARRHAPLHARTGPRLHAAGRRRARLLPHGARAALAAERGRRHRRDDAGRRGLVHLHERRRRAAAERGRHRLDGGQGSERRLPRARREHRLPAAHLRRRSQRRRRERRPRARRHRAVSESRWAACAAGW